jgi:flavin reductase (DIM6/NTAB) family NADH-FMN oxidoreductase RutF
MSKKLVPPSTTLLPLPVVLATCGEMGQDANIITIAWCGIVCSEPPMLSISVRENRHSFNLIKSSGEFVVNVTGANIVNAVDFCGNNSGKNVDKFAATGLTPIPATKVKPPLIKESPINLECQVRRSFDLGSHTLFIAEIVATNVDEDYLDEKGRLNIKKIDPISYCPGVREYWSGLTVLHGNYGYSRGNK